MMRRLLFLSLALSFAAVFGAAAQSLDAFKRQLAEPAAAPGLLFGRAQVIAVEYGDAGRTVAEASRAERATASRGIGSASSRTTARRPAKGRSPRGNFSRRPSRA